MSWNVTLFILGIKKQQHHQLLCARRTGSMVQSVSILACLALCQLIPLATPAQIPLLPQSHTEGYEFDPLLHLPGISPYFDAVGFGLSHEAPRHCEVTAASYLIRHAAIYANDRDYKAYIEPFLIKLNSTYTIISDKKQKPHFSLSCSYSLRTQSNRITFEQFRYLLLDDCTRRRLIILAKGIYGTVEPRIMQPA